MISSKNSQLKPQAQGNTVENVSINGDFTFAPVQIGTQIETQIIQISATQVTQQPLIRTSPYQGLKRFNVQDRERFFGRDKLIARLFEAVNHSSLNLILGASGSGKSSVVRAGLIPELKKSLESNTFYDFIFTPNHNPFESFYRCLLNQEKDYHYTEFEVKIAKIAQVDTLQKVIKTLKKDNEKWIIFIDQFEEVFTTCQDVDIRNKFIEAIVRVASMNDSSVRIVLAMRSDFLEQFSFHSHLAELINTQHNIHLITEMYPDELRQAIEQPAAKHGVVFEEGLVEQIIDEVEGQSGYLPLLQYTLNLLWEKECITKSSDGRAYIEDRVLNKASYIDLEGVRGALQKRVDNIYQSLSQDEQEATRKIFINLVNIIETNSGRKVVSRRAYCKEFTEEIVKNTIDRLVDENLLITSNEYSSISKLMLAGVKKIKESGTVEIAHEILLSSWKTLKNWIEQEKEAILLKNWLAVEATRWHKIYLENPTRACDELLKGSRLQQIIEYRSRDGFKRLGGLNQDENTFIEASIAWREKTIQSEKHQLLVLRGLLVGVSTALVFAVGATLFAFQQATIAKLSEQAAQARLTSTTNPANGLLEAIYLTGESLKNIPHLESVRLTLADLLEVPVERNVFTGHKQNVTSVAVSPSGNYIASASEDKTVRLLDMRGNLVTKPFKGHTDYVTSVAFSPDGNYIITGSNDKTIRLWDLQGNTIRTFNGRQGVIRDVAFSRDGKNILSAGDDGISLWDLNGKQIQFEATKGQRINSVAFSPDGKTIASGGSQALQFWDITGKPIGTPINVHEYTVNSVVFSPDGKYVATSGNDNKVRLVDVQKKNIRNTVLKNDIHLAAFTPDSKRIAIATGKNVLVTDLDGIAIGQPLRGHESNITSAAFVPNSNYLFTGSWDKTVRLWNLSTLTEKVPASEDNKALLKVGCNRLLSHPSLLTTQTQEAVGASKTCQKYAWENADKSQFFVNQGFLSAREGNLEQARVSFRQARKLNRNLDKNLEAQAQRIAEQTISENKENNSKAAITPPNIANNATYGQVKLSEFTLNNKGNIISVAPGEKINAFANYVYNCPDCQPTSINQIIVGIAGQNQAQACIYNGSIKASGSNKFSLTAPDQPGLYYIRFRYAQEFGCNENVLGWWRVDGEPTATANIGAIIVTNK